MRIVRCGKTVMELARRSYSNVYKALNDFIDSGLDCAEVVDYTNKDAKSCSGSLALGIKRYGYHQIGVSMRGQHVYLYRKDI